jgi:hypothetical protein
LRNDTRLILTGSYPGKATRSQEIERQAAVANKVRSKRYRPAKSDVRCKSRQPLAQWLIGLLHLRECDAVMASKANQVGIPTPCRHEFLIGMREGEESGHAVGVSRDAKECPSSLVTLQQQPPVCHPLPLDKGRQTYPNLGWENGHLVAHVGSYVRVSTLDRDTVLQLDALAAAESKQVFEDRASGAERHIGVRSMCLSRRVQVKRIQRPADATPRSQHCGARA